MFLDVRCPGCGEGYFRFSSPVCPDCVAEFGPSVPLQISGVTDACAGASHEGAARRLVLAGKSQGRTTVFRQMAQSLAKLAELQRWAQSCDLITWVPGSPTNVRVRGYDQGKILAVSISKSFGLPAVGLFRREAGAAQTGLSRQDRQFGPRLVLTMSPPARVLVVDDVITTGVSMCVAGTKLREEGTEQVFAVSLTTRLRSQTS